MDDLLKHLVPTNTFISGFTTSDHIKHASLQHVELADKPLGVHKVSSKTTHNIVKPPPTVTASPNDPHAAWEAVYPEGSINPGAQIPGGFGFYLAGPPSFAKQLETATEAIFSYRMMLQEGWIWVKGGKLPGIFGGVGDLSYACTGGRKDQRCQCFNLRPMWRPEGVGELYAYLPLTAQNSAQLSAVPPRSIENSDYGFSVGRGAYHFTRAVCGWITIAFRVKLNDVGSNNGELQLWIDGESVMSVGGLQLRESADGKIKGMHFQTFFGGHGNEWASPKDQRAWFSDVTAVVLQ
ncbi:polysaccharide lyase family 14 protein [Pholiota conissans]|uniref:Polysaccharide lyase family 14 protein n=1 Tax=Pholiota conissans TaxID=109636 RepID=A0A9P5Z8T5_9AGAR|nr:polysaccharide lyase family 14 protein [Pholiota conissans]